MKIVWWEPPQWLLVGAYCALAALCYAGLFQFACGLLLVQFLEYANHRWLLHRFVTKRHRAHHIDASKYISLPLTVILASLALLWLVLPVGVMAGVLIGYAIHEIVHRISPPWHERHHKDRRKSFGVTTPVVDWMLGTR